MNAFGFLTDRRRASDSLDSRRYVLFDLGQVADDDIGGMFLAVDACAFVVVGKRGSRHSNTFLAGEGPSRHSYPLERGGQRRTGPPAIRFSLLNPYTSEEPLIFRVRESGGFPRTQCRAVYTGP